MSVLSPITEIIEEIRSGRIVVLVDEEDRENEGDLVLAADFVTPEAINFMAKYARGLVCLTLRQDRCEQLNLPLMVSSNGTSFGTNFTVSIEAAEGVTTGISAADRALTIKKAVAYNAKPADLVQPGHIFPVMAQPGGVLVRAGHTEAGCDLTELAGLTPASVICEIMNEDGTMARLPQLMEFAAEHGLKIGTITDLIQYRSSTETLIECVGSRKVQTFAGEFDLHVFRDKLTQDCHLALTLGEIGRNKETLVRVHEPVSLIDFLDRQSARHTFSLDQAQRALAQSEAGVIVLLRRPQTDDEIAEWLGTGTPAEAARSLVELALDMVGQRGGVHSHGVGDHAGGDFVDYAVCGVKVC